MLIAFLSRLIPGFEAACTRLRLNHGKPKDVFSDLWFLIDHYLKRGELDRAEALSHSLVALAEGETVRWTDPELFPVQKSLRYKTYRQKIKMLSALVLLVPVLVLSQHQWLLTGMAKEKMRSGQVKEAISLLRSELAIENLYSHGNVNVQLSLADALICDHQLPEAGLLIQSALSLDPRHQRAIYLDLQIAMLTGESKRANQDALMLSQYMTTKELISTLLMSNVLIGHGPYADFQTMLQLSATSQGFTGFKMIIKNSLPELEEDQKLSTAMGYFCKACHDDEKAARWFKQSLTLLRGSKFKSDRVRFIDAVHQYVELVAHTKPIEARRLEWTALGIANQNNLPYESIEDKCQQTQLSLLQ